MILILYACLSAPSYRGVIVALVLVTLAQAASMCRRDPITRTTIPFAVPAADARVSERVG
jgi:hypothetical protein